MKSKSLSNAQNTNADNIFALQIKSFDSSKNMGSCAICQETLVLHYSLYFAPYKKMENWNIFKIEEESWVSISSLYFEKFCRCDLKIKTVDQSLSHNLHLVSV